MEVNAIKIPTFSPGQEIVSTEPINPLLRSKFLEGKENQVPELWLEGPMRVPIAQPRKPPLSSSDGRELTGTVRATALLPLGRVCAKDKIDI